MMNQTSPERVRQDSRLIGQTLLKLALPRLLLRAIVIAVALIIWYFVANWIPDAGKRVSFEFLHCWASPRWTWCRSSAPTCGGSGSASGASSSFALRAWLSASLASGRATPVQTEVLAELAPQLSDESLGVLRWTWGDREEPFTVGDLRRSLSEIRHSRIAKIDMVARQAEILEGGGKPRAGSPRRRRPAPRTARRPLRRAAHRPRPISDTLPRNPPEAAVQAAFAFQCAASKPLLYWLCHARATAGRASYRHHAPAAPAATARPASWSPLSMFRTSVRFAASMALACSAALSFSAPARAAWPDKPITFVALFTAGGANDLSPASSPRRSARR